jgi:RNA polymerase sigma factor (sigma-70 family)
MEKEITDATLIREYLTGKDKAFEKLYRKYERPLYSFIYRFVGSRESAEDVFQQTWLKAIRALENYDERGKFGSWIFGIANNACLDLVRQKSVLKRDDFASEDMDHLPQKEMIPDESIINKEQRTVLENGIEALPWEQKQVVLLRVYAEMSFKEIAAMIDAPLNTVLGRMHYAEKNLRKIIHTTYGEDR